MRLAYKIANKIIETEVTDSNVEIIEIIKDNRVIVKVIAKSCLELVSFNKIVSHIYDKKDLIFVNGYQSWTDSFEYNYQDKLKDVTRLPQKLVSMFAFDRYGDACFQKYDKKVLHGFDISYVKGNNPICVINYNYKNAYLIIEHHKKKNEMLLNSDVKNKILKENEEYIVFDYVLDSNITEALKQFTNSLNKPKAEKLFGYTSWYNHYQNISEEIIMNALNNQDEKFDLFQIDDGYEEYVGDWLRIDKKKFPNGLKPIVDEIHNRGMKAGIWLAPFAAEEKSLIFQKHKDWIKKDCCGNPLKAGGNWSGFYALDIENPEVVNYIKEFLSYYVDLGFDFFKLDFLYAAHLGEFSGKTRSEVAEHAYSLLRECLKDKLILGCGATIANSISRFDYLRIGPDVSLKFDDVWYMKFMHRERISTKVTLRNTIYRSFLNGSAFLNDPDVFLLRDDNIWLNDKQKYALTIINALFGSLLMTSDNPKKYDAKKHQVLDEALNLYYNAKVISYETKKNKIIISYSIENEIKVISYDIKKGVLYNG